MAHLLIVEDDELLRDGLCAQLVHAGHSVSSASDGAQAQSLLESTRFDGVVLDLRSDLSLSPAHSHVLSCAWPLHLSVSPCRTSSS